MEKKSIGLIHLTPVVLTLILSSLLTPAFLYLKVPDLIESPFAKQNTLTASVYNAFIFSILIGLGTLIMYFLVKKRKLHLMRLFFQVAVFLTFFSINQLFSLVILQCLGLELESEIIEVIWYIFIPAITAFGMCWIIFTSTAEILVMLLTVLYGTSIGVIFAFSLPLWSILVIAILMSAYDLYSVFKGPLKRLIDVMRDMSSQEITASPQSDVLRGVTVPFRGLRMGVGDIFFYSMLNSSCFLLRSYTPILTFLVSASIIAGVYFTLKEVEKRGYMPALPIPLLSSTAIICLWVFLFE